MKNFSCHLSDVQTECEILLRFLLLETHYESSTFVLLFFFSFFFFWGGGVKDDKAPHAIIASSAQLFMRTTVKSGSSTLQKTIR